LTLQFPQEKLIYSFSIALSSDMQHEIETLNNEEFKQNANWLQMLTSLMEDIQDQETPESEAALAKWACERDEIR